MEEEKEEKNSKNNTVKFDKKTIFIIVLIAVIVIMALFIAFSQNNKTEKSNSDVTISKIEDSAEKQSDDKVENTVINKITTPTIQKISLNEAVSKEEKYELVVKSFRFGKNIEPPNTSGYYSYYDASDDHKYLEIVCDYKNLGTSDVRADKVLSIKIKYNDKYEYSGFTVIEDEEGDFTYSNITSISALSTGKLHYLIEVPDEVANDTGSIVATVKCGQDSYEINLR